MSWFRRISMFLSCCVAAVGIAAPVWAQLSRKLDNYGGVVGINGEKTGWFHVEKFNDRWLLVTPEGNGFFSLGVTHAVDCIRKDELNLFESKFDRDKGKLGDFIVERIKEWGYNSSGYGALPSMERQVPYIATIWTEGPKSLSAGERSKYTDVFDPQVQRRLRKTVLEKAARHVENPFCLGYVFIDLPIWSPTFAGRRGGQSYADYFRGLNASSAGKQAYCDFLASRYENDQAALKATYEIAYGPSASLLSADFSDVSANGNATIAGDDELFLALAAATYYKCVVEELRAVDPHHLICGDRLIAGSDKTPDAILKVAAKYVDVLSFQPLGTKQLIGPYVDHVTKITGKPVLLADVNTMTRRPDKNEANNAEYQRSAGEHAQAYYHDAASCASCIGIHRCTIRDYQPWNTKYHRRGSHIPQVPDS